MAKSAAASRSAGRHARHDRVRPVSQFRIQFNPQAKTSADQHGTLIAGTKGRRDGNRCSVTISGHSRAGGSSAIGCFRTCATAGGPAHAGADPGGEVAACRTVRIAAKRADPVRQPGAWPLHRSERRRCRDHPRAVVRASFRGEVRGDRRDVRSVSRQRHHHSAWPLCEDWVDQPQASPLPTRRPRHLARGYPRVSGAAKELMAKARESLASAKADLAAGRLNGASSRLPCDVSCRACSARDARHCHRAASETGRSSAVSGGPS